MPGHFPVHLTAREAAAELGVSRATLYAYVSRGLIRSEAQEGKRSRLYRAQDVRALVARRDGPEASTAALDWGAPVLTSQITLISENRLYYRGRDVETLAAHSSLESVAALLWEAESDPFATEAPPAPRSYEALLEGTRSLRGLERALSLIPVVAAGDPSAFNLQPSGLVLSAARVVRWLTAVTICGVPSTLPIHAQLAAAWDLDDGVALLVRRALVLCADHELNTSAFTVRCVASTGASPYAAVCAGLAALMGPRHGGVTERIDAHLPELLSSPRDAVEARLRRGDEIPGFGHPLYPGGDPRARDLLGALHAHALSNPVSHAAADLCEAMHTLTQRRPAIDFALSVLARALNLPPGSAMTLFALGRVVGWLAHAHEQYRMGQLIRPRAKYTGHHPGKNSQPFRDFDEN